MHRFIMLIVLILVAASGCRSLRTTMDSNETESEIRAVKIHESSGFIGPCEPTICINPADPSHIVAGAVLDYVYTSADRGQTWTVDTLSSSWGVYGDPVIRANSKGDFYYAHLSNPGSDYARDDAWLDRIVIQKSTDNGRSWSDGSYTEPRSPKDQDKHWLALDPATDHIYITWTEFDLYGSEDPRDKSRIVFSRSIDGGESWSVPLRISQFEGNCLDGDQTPEGAVPSVGIGGELYVAWSYDEKIYFDRSSDGGLSWLEEDIVAAEQPGGWSFSVPGIMRTNGMPITAVDRSDGPHRGTVYINWSDQRNGTSDTDVWIIRSDDAGSTWSQPVRVNNDKGEHHQFFTWMAVDDATGHIYIVFYDRRAHEDETTDVYLAWSTDGGHHFKNKKINSRSFKPNAIKFFGDYNDIDAHNGMIRPIWTQMDNFLLSIWTAMIEADGLEGKGH